MTTTPILDWIRQQIRQFQCKGVERERMVLLCSPREHDQLVISEIRHSYPGPIPLYDQDDLYMIFGVKVCLTHDPSGYTVVYAPRFYFAKSE